MDTYWQSDGQLPHLVNIQFHRKTSISQIYIYTDYKLDESYTPSRISIRAGSHFNDLQELQIVDLTEPTGKCNCCNFISFFLLRLAFMPILIKVGWLYRLKTAALNRYGPLCCKLLLFLIIRMAATLTCVKFVYTHLWRGVIIH